MSNISRMLQSEELLQHPGHNQCSNTNFTSKSVLLFSIGTQMYDKIALSLHQRANTCHFQLKCTLQSVVYTAGYILNARNNKNVQL